MSNDRVMLLIDADNVSVDVMDQAVRMLLQQHGGLHVRRAYCTAESAVANQGAFKHLGIKPMVNLAAGKNSTDIALAVDAIDLVLAERPDVVVIASSDSDFAPLVHRLREKGCVVRGIGQQGKTGDETREVYDDFTEFEHRKAAPAAGAGAKSRRPARKSAAKTADPATAKPAAKVAPAKKAAPRKKAAAAAAVEVAEASSPPRRRSARKTASAAAQPAEIPDALPEDAPVAAPAAAPAPPHGGRVAPTLQAVLACLPELAAGQTLALNVAVQRLREGRLLGRNTPSARLFAQLSDHFELVPADQPSQVRLR